MIVYQIYIKGSMLGFGESFTMHSKKVYKRKPTREEIDEFVKACSDEKCIKVLDKNEEYEVKILELSLER